MAMKYKLANSEKDTSDEHLKVYIYQDFKSSICTLEYHYLLICAIILF